jgi:hypothetical protein
MSSTHSNAREADAVSHDVPDRWASPVSERSCIFGEAEGFVIDAIPAKHDGST